MSDQHSLEGCMPRRLSDNEPIDYEPRQYVTTGQSVSSSSPSEQGKSGETSEQLIADLIRESSRILSRDAPRCVADLAVLEAAQAVISTLSENIQFALNRDADRVARRQSPKSNRKAATAKT
jgi:hypothetical protein